MINSKEEIDIMKIIKSFEESGLLIRGVRETIKNEAKKTKSRFLSISLDILGGSLLGNFLTGKTKVTRAGEGTIKAGKGTIRAEQDF